jgi:1,5-anhydro-D-fructose reductase (1,5-anhydro-D-mannitol-forming)
VKEIVDSGILGRILRIDLIQHFPAREEDLRPGRPPWRVVPEISGGGYFHDMGCHALDILFYLFGDPVSTLGQGVNVGGLYEAADTVSAILTLPEGVQLTGSWSFVVPLSQQADRVRVTGEQGGLSFSVFSFEPITLELPGGAETFSIRQPEHIQMPLIGTIVGELQGKASCPSTGTTAAVTSMAMDRICGAIPG